MKTTTGSRRSARSFARRFAARLVGKTGKRARPGFPATFDRASPGGGLAIEMWRAEDDGTAVTDRQLQVNVFDQFARDRLLDATEIRVDVHDRTVTLSGAVRGSLEKALAEQAARRVAGVERVQSEIMVVRALAS